MLQMVRSAGLTTGSPHYHGPGTPGRVALRSSLSFVDGDTPDELFLARLFRFVEQRLQRPRSRLVRVARFADFTQSFKVGP